MLLNFTATNFKTFRDKVTFSMEPAPKQKGLDYSIFTKEVDKKEYKGLSTAVIYGPNASGKTNIIGAMEAFKNIVLRGNLSNAQIQSPNASAFQLELIPNSSLEKAEPVTFGIKFITQDYVIEYSMSLDLGLFLQSDYPRKVLWEELKVNEKTIFVRDNQLRFESLETITGLLNDSFNDPNDLALFISLAHKGLMDSELFLMNGFRVIFSSKMAEIISNWLLKKFVVICRADAIRIKRKPTKENAANIDQFLTKLAQRFGTDSKALAYLNDENDHNAMVLSSMVKEDGPRGAFIPAELYESFGTVRFVNMFPLLLETIQEGGTLLVDEFDASIHPMVIMNIINIFHNDEINVNHAQLIFNTHNPIFLNSNLLRRDEIKFVERDAKTHYSHHYSLSDFGTTGPNGVRKGEDYLKNYFVDSYGAISEVDFSDFFKNEIEK